MKTLLKTLATAGSALALALSSGACSQADTPAPATASAAPMQAAADYVTPALWMLQDEDTTIYLFGTVHILPKGVEWYDGRIAAAFEGSDEVVTEIDMSNQAAIGQLFMSRGMLPPGQSLRDLMTDEDRAQYEAALTELGIPVAQFDRFEPWMASIVLSQLPMMKAGYDPNSGVEMALLKAGPDKERGALETAEFQVDMFDGLPMETQLTFLDETVENLGGVVTTIDAMVAEWLAGDPDGLAVLLNDNLDDPVLYQRLLTDRNANWAVWIDDRMDQPGTVFVAVGAGHLAGEDSVQGMLEDRGFTVTRVTQ
ncbi:TraB/GumN family protein [Paraurantiacibacter namhicola]|uniref:TraB family protein n=1 Tax=Paraurantiacibacter namhicola TaxID=645517 RepID=A0A1C7D9A4_9SPHN|nr:TraB/GumN family protein [Paraurantiacibacter namhicola]ANU08028.1 TraB family protein [Paraurantiacibacter namhicola]